MTIQEILEQHPKVLTMHICFTEWRMPVILDSNNDVLFPPIINGEHTTVPTKTRNLFVDVTGLIKGHVNLL